MIPLKKFMQVSTINGVDEYILVDQKAEIIAHDIENPVETAKMTFSCGQTCFAIGRTQFKYLIFTRKNQKNFFIFPVGNYYLGVVKLENIDDCILADNVIEFLKDLI